MTNLARPLEVPLSWQRQRDVSRSMIDTIDIEADPKSSLIRKSKHAAIIAVDAATFDHMQRAFSTVRPSLTYATPGTVRAASLPEEVELGLLANSEWVGQWEDNQPDREGCLLAAAIRKSPHKFGINIGFWVAPAARRPIVPASLEVLEPHIPISELSTHRRYSNVPLFEPPRF